MEFGGFTGGSGSAPSKNFGSSTATSTAGEGDVFFGGSGGGGLNQTTILAISAAATVLLLFVVILKR